MKEDIRNELRILIQRIIAYPMNQLSGGQNHLWKYLLLLLSSIYHTCQPDRAFSNLTVLYRELLHLYRDLSLEKINERESNNF